jgi:hypothetical protein
VKSWDLDIDDIEELVGPAETWPGRCHEVALAAASLIDDGEAVYGHYTGPVASTGYWAYAKAFEDEEPEIEVIEPDEWAAENYDEGGNRTRREMMSPPPKWDPKGDPGDRTVALPVPKGTEVEMALNTLLGEDQHGTNEHGAYVVTARQAHWLGNVPYEMLAPHQQDIYAIMGAAGLAEFIPLDNRIRASRE